jgi:aspartyl-tRNA(Asn)/glutamyl-tRNA(Gln) amidotransferase subunit B
VVTSEWVEEIRKGLPELPDAKRDRLMSLGLSRYDASVLVAVRAAADYFDAVLATGVDAKKAANWIMNELFARMNKAAIDIEKIADSAEQKVTPEAVGGLIKLIDAGTINNNAAKKVLDSLFAEGGDPKEWVAKLGLEQTSDTGAIEAVIDTILNANAGEVARFCAGEEKVAKFLVGQVMREGKGKFPADIVNRVLTEKLKSRC